MKIDKFIEVLSKFDLEEKMLLGVVDEERVLYSSTIDYFTVETVLKDINIQRGLKQWKRLAISHVSLTRLAFPELGLHIHNIKGKLTMCFLDNHYPVIRLLKSEKGIYFLINKTNKK